MKIYALLGSFRHEGDTLLGVYASKEEAIEMRHSQFISMPYPRYIIETRELGHAAGEDHVFDGEISEYI